MAFFDRLTKGALLNLLRTEVGEGAADDWAKLKKPDLAVAVFERPPSGWLPPPIMGAVTLDREASDEAGDDTSEDASESAVAA